VPPSNINQGATVCAASLPIGVVNSGAFKGQAFTADSFVNGSEVNRWGIGVVQEIDSAAMHLFARWQHLDLDLGSTDGRLCTVGVATITGCRIGGDPLGVAGVANKHFGKNDNTSFEGLDIFQVGGVIFF
ncbi:MAG: hypothetical protein WBE67_10100, partial [Methyloceanibacter sp.]